MFWFLPALLPTCAVQLLPTLRRITIQPDSKFKNTATFVIMKEDHTLGNLLKAYEIASLARSRGCWPSYGFVTFRVAVRELCTISIIPICKAR